MRRNARGEGRRNDAGGLGCVLKVNQGCRTPPKTMRHYILEGYIMIKCKGRSRVCMEAEAFGGKEFIKKDFLQGSSNMSINNLMVGKELTSKNGGRGEGSGGNGG